MEKDQNINPEDQNEEIKDNKINHILNFYKAEDGKFKKVF